MCECTLPELWAPIPGWECYYKASTRGGVSSERCRGRLLVPWSDPRGYRTLTLRADGVVVKRLVHHLVLEAFVGLRPPGMEACHGDGDPSHNCVGNLRWDTPSSNAYDRVRHGTHHCVNRTVCPLGHLLAEPNLRKSVRGEGRRGCLACHRTSANQSYALRMGRNFDFRPAADRHYQRIMVSG